MNNSNLTRKQFFAIAAGLATAGFFGIRSLPNSTHSTIRTGGQFVPTKIEAMPKSGYLLTDGFWQKRSKDCYDILLDFDAEGKHLPVIWIDSAKRHYNFDMFALPAYLGDYRQNLERMESHEALSSIGAVLGASLSGIDMSNYNGRDFVKELLGFHQKDGVSKILLNQTLESGSESSFWYMIYPNLSFYAVNSLYPGKEIFDDVSREIADQLIAMLDNLKKIDGTFSFEFTGYNFLRSEGIYGAHKEPDSAAGIGWILLMAYHRFNDERYLAGAKKCFDYLEGLTAEENPFYEVLLAFGVTAAARMNAELGTTYDVDKYFAWIFDGFSTSRAGWGIISDTWGDYEIHGLQGSTTDSGGYAFAFNTFNIIAALAPLPLYDSRYTNAIGRWLFHTINGARIFYPDQIAPEFQSHPEFIDQYNNGLAYEGVRKEWAFTTPYATADSRRMTWAETDIGIYGSGLVGVLAGIVVSGSPDGLMIFDITKTDFFGKSPRTHLVYNYSDKNIKWEGNEIPSGESQLVKFA